MSANSSAKNKSTIESWLFAATRQLTDSGIPSSRLDALILLEDILDKDRSWILAHPEHELMDAQLISLDAWIHRRSTHEPLAYIRKKVEFYGRNFVVDPRVLVPRPESESVISQLLAVPISHEPGTVIADIGTGSGALGITAKLELPFCEVLAIDIDPNCLTIATQNATALGADIQTMQSDLLSIFSARNTTIPTPVILLCNLPYVPQEYPVNQAAQHEPTLALYSGSDGLDHYRTLFSQAALLVTPPRYIITESLITQHTLLRELAKRSVYNLHKTAGLVQVFSKDAM